MNRLSSLLPLIVLAALAIPLSLFLSPKASPNGGLRITQTPEEIREATAEILDQEGVDTTPLHAEIRLQRDQRFIRQIHEMLGLAAGNQVLRASHRGYRWVARWSEKSSINVSFGGNDEEKAKSVDAWLKGNVRAEKDMQGNLVRFERTIPDSLALPSVSGDSSLSLIREFARIHALLPISVGGSTIGSYINDSAAAPRAQKLLQRTDHVLEWSTKDSLTGDPVTLHFRVSGSFVSQFSISYDVPERFGESGLRQFAEIFDAVTFIVLFIILIVVSFKRFRAYEIGFRLAIVIGIATGTGLAIKLFTLLSPSTGWEIIFPLLFGPLFYGGGAVLMWAASESTVRETWREKLVSLDLLARGYVAHSRIGRGIVRGTAFGIIAYAVYLAIAFLLDSVTPIAMVASDDSTFDFAASAVPTFSILLEGFYGQVYVIALFFMFLASWLYKRTGRGIIAGGAIVLLLAGMRGLVYDPVWAGLLLSIIPVSIVTYTFIRYDVLTAFLALMVSAIGEYTTILSASTHPFFTESAVMIGGILGVLVVTGLASQFRKNEEVNLEEIAPAYEKHITERERLRHELAIARDVQMSFLPKANPSVASLDIASRCAPALEVGGDYYDFVELPDGKLGVAVGDVSGKGTQAAFFMTLTKGFLRALARVSRSPGKVLSEVNRLFYENVERGVFISLIYGIFDTETTRLSIARAGHNPVILRKSILRDTQILNPMGLALGLDEGSVFDESVKEVTVSYEPGDVFVFYTDGISEAMNRTREEYGEQRLSASIEAHAQKSASDILEGILEDMRSFVGRAEQHDDVTLVVVKIT